MLELLSLPYAGSRGPAVRLCADKLVTNHVHHWAGLPVLPSREPRPRVLPSRQHPSPSCGSELCPKPPPNPVKPNLRRPLRDPEPPRHLRLRQVRDVPQADQPPLLV